MNLSGFHLNYYGGRVMSNVQVAVVFWTANVDFTTHNQIKGFFSTINNSPYLDMLSEYNTVGLNGFADGMPGSNQTIGRGTAIGPFTISPSISGTTVDDSQIISELQAQITAGNLPSPATDGSGNVNTLYMVYFPLGYTITLGTDTSCVAFCAYHGTYSNNNLSIPYGVMPDLSAPGCNGRCGGAAATFDNLTSVSSHELAESITDTEVGIAQSFNRPLAWYDVPNNVEIGDICNHVHAILSGYTVQQEWSNSRNTCFAPAGDILASTTTLQIANAPSSRLRATVTFTATVQGSGPAPTGQVTFFDGATLLATLPLSSAQASFTTNQLTVGLHHIQASYSGDAAYAPSFNTQTLRYRPPLSR